MQTFNFLEKELLDIIFKDRNQQYGAYTLRKHYPERLRNALVITSVVVFSALTVYLFNTSKTLPSIDVLDTQTKPHIIKTLNLIKPATGESGPLQKKTLTENPPLEIVKNEAKSLPAMDKDKLLVEPNNIFKSKDGQSTSAIGSGFEKSDKTSTGMPGDYNHEEIIITKAQKTVEPTIVNMAEIMPVFPGGEDALIKYLQENIKYPKLATSNHISGTVYVEFVVNTQGSISRVKILKGIGGGCDEEAMRVIKQMPLWSPGSQNGQKMNVSYRVPVTFTL